MLYEVITRTGKAGLTAFQACSIIWSMAVITSYSIHYTKLYELPGRRVFVRVEEETRALPLRVDPERAEDGLVQAGVFRDVLLFRHATVFPFQLMFQVM